MSDVVAGSSPAPTNSAASSPASSATPSSAPSSSTPASASVTSASTPNQGSAPAPEQSIPYTRFKEVNDQLKAAREFQSKYERLQWAEQFHQDPYTFVDSWVDQLANHPQYQAQILAKAARMLQSRRGSQPAQVEKPKATVPIVDGQGNVTGYTYNAEGWEQYDAWREQQRQQAFDQRLQPLEDMKQSLEQQQVQAAIQHQSNQFASTTLDKMRQRPWFKEHEAAIKQHFAEHEEYGDNLQAAALDYFAEHIEPTYGQKAESRVLETLTTQAAGGTVNPSQTAPSQKPKFKDFGEALRYYAEHPDEASAMANR